MSSQPLFPERSPSPQGLLRLFVEPQGDPADEAQDGPAGPDGLSAGVTLPEFWQHFFRPVRLIGADPKTLKEDRSTLKKWRAYAGDRPLVSIDRPLLAGFAAWLEGEHQPKLARVTAAKHLARVQTFLRAAGPDDGDGLCAELLAKVVRVKPPRTPTKEPDKAFRLVEIGSWLDACAHAAPMKGCERPAAWWQSIVLFDYCCPLRFEGLTAARWEWLQTREHLPGWWLKCGWESDKKDHERWYYVSGHALAALSIAFPQQLANLRSGQEPPAGPIFGLPITPARLYAHAKTILARSAINPARQQQRVFHGLRAAADTELRKLGFPIAAKRALGRSVGRDVDMGFYTGAEEYAAGMEKLPQPAFSRWREPQLRLF